MYKCLVKPKISVIIPSYNSAKYIKECLDSVIFQSLKEIEILCIDAYSIDGTIDILKSYEKQDSRIKIIFSKKKSLGYQINLGLKEAKGEYFTIVESDDYVKIDMCEKLYRLARNQDCQVVKSDFIGFEDKEKERIFKNLPICYDQTLYNKKTNSYLNPSIIINSWNMNQSSLYKMDFIKKYDIRANETQGASYQDIGLWFQILSLASSIYFYKEGFYFYRQDNEHASVKSKDKIYCVCDEFEFLDKFLDKNLELKSRLQDVFYYFKFKIYLWNLKRIDDKYKLEFLYKFSQDFSLIYDKLDKTVFKVSEISEISCIVQDPSKYHKKYNSVFYGIKKKIFRIKRKYFR
ncbi:glycosyltransferase family 2 protein [Campylobacter jejuni]|nr:glycosyltransferase family 2 protein [Campylobacter jejuni]EAJ7038755.1 glycosyltransferase family 2 protein [Campylobacter jejuni]EAJ7666196.1 glycosyltransferase family 2 protein [Campylobacter jejuni]MPB48107.1 glycosyltransferase family 2 protein [Campylobacter jejuni]